MFKFSEESNYLMPAHFGGYAGQPQPATYHDVTSIVVAYESDAAMLGAFLPEPIRLTQPLLTVQYTMCRQVEWMAGGGYNLVTVGVPAAYEHGRERVEGLYALVIWENRTAPILAGREQSGMPKIFADITDHHHLGETLLTNASYDGWTFLRMDFRRTKPMTSDELRGLNQQMATVNALGWRYIPNIGRPGAALSHATVFPQESKFASAWEGEGRVHWNGLGFEQNAGYSPITQALSRLPNKGYRRCMMTQGSMVLRNDLSRQLP